MKHKTNIRIQAFLYVVVLAWFLGGVAATYAIEGQVGWFLGSLAVLLATTTAVVAELRLARWTSSAAQEDARATVEAWPHVITLLEDLERIEPERAEMVEVVKLEMAEHLSQARIVADGRTPSVRELLRRRKSAP